MVSLQECGNLPVSSCTRILITKDKELKSKFGFVLLNAINIHDEIHEIHVRKFIYIHLILSFTDVKVKIVLNHS